MKKLGLRQESENMAIYVDLDGTLAEYHGWKGPNHIGPPIEPMLNRVRAWVRGGIVVKIFTARASVHEQIPPIKSWLAQLGLGDLEVTCIKGFDGEEFWDDRAVTVEANTGRILTK